MSTVAHHDLKASLTKIAEEVAHAYPEGEFELHLHPRGTVHGRRLNGSADQVLAGFLEFCIQVPGAEIKYAPAHPYGMLSDIICTCEGLRCPCQAMCHSSSERPWAMLLLIQDGGKDILLGRLAPPCVHDGMNAMESVHQQLSGRSLHAVSDLI
ncbi:MAG: hypothetical protein IT364_18055 [Candidatus Hydrogenedentes bacterium]|nr:hypothetical protein [Candidatus Hydrogenedentota bacterium]